MNRLPCSLILTVILPASATGADVRYSIRARLDEPSRTLDCTQQVFIFNSAPETLGSLRFHLYPNAFRSLSTKFARERQAAGLFDFSLSRPAERGFLALHRLTCSRAISHSDPTADELEVTIHPPLAPLDTVTLTFDFTVRLPFPFAGLGVRGRRFILNSWYPQLAFRDSSGWRAAGFSSAGGSGAYFADYEVRLTVPSDLRIAATGTLTAPAVEVELMKMPPGETRTNGCATKTLLFHAWEVPDFAWLAAPDLVLTQDSCWGINVNLFTQRRRQADWYEATERIRRIIWNYAHWYGPLSTGSLTVVDGSGLVPQDISLPGLVVIATRPNLYLRLLERSLAYGIAEQWFNVRPCPDPHSSTWLRSGLPAFSTLRHLEAEHGQDNLLNLPFSVPFLTGCSEEYLNLVLFGIAARAGLSRPADTERHELPTEPFGQDAFGRYQAGLQLRSLQRLLGERELDQSIRTYLSRNRQRCPSVADFLSVLPDTIRPLLLANPGFTDYSISGVRQSSALSLVEVRRSPGSPLPVDIEVHYSDGTVETLFWERTDSATSRTSLTLHGVHSKRHIARATINPACRLLEPNRWNNSWPCRWEIKPVFALPSLDAYQLFYGPYFWFDNYHGTQLGLWAQGRRFVDIGPISGAHMWTVSETYSTRIRDWHSNLTYSSPLTFISPRLRLRLAGDYSLISAGACARLELGLGRQFSLPRASLNLSFRLTELRDLRGRDMRAWRAGRLSELNFKSTHSSECRLLKRNSSLLIALGLPRLGSSHRYYKLSTEHNHTLRLDRRLSLTIRGFAGAIFGKVLPQEEFYLSGGLTPTDDEPVSLGYQGASSSQEHWHYDADANCRGYAGSYRHGRWAYGINIYLPGIGPVQPFIDIGNVAATPDETDFWPPRADAGLRLKLGPLYLDLPIWKSHPRPLERHLSLRWLMGLKISGLLDNH